MNINSDIGVWIAALLTLGVFSALYKETALFRFVESVFIGVSAGYFFCIWFFSVISPAISDGVEGEWHIFIPIITGILILVLRENRFSRFLTVPASLLAAVFIALNFIIYFRAYIVDMVLSSVQPLVVFDDKGGVNWGLTINSIVSVTGTVSVLIFFAARRYPDVKMIRGYGEIGRFYLLVAIGTSLGYTLFSRILIFAGRFDFLFSEWLGIRFY